MAIPVSIEDARRQIQLDENDTSLDAELVTAIEDAVSWVEKYTGHVMVARDIVEQFASFDRLRLKAWPIKPGAVVDIAYTTGTGAAADLYGARIAGSTRPAVVLPAAGGRWPSGASSVTVVVRAGYESTDVVPGNLRRAMLILISAYESDREGGDVFQKAEASARRLCRGYRVRSL